MSHTFDIVIVPGLNNSGPGHWQTLWQLSLAGASRVEQTHWSEPQRDAWVDGLERHVSSCRRPVILVAHSLGCITVSHWARHHDTSTVAGALLVAPADVERASASVWLRDFAPIPAAPFPFPVHVIASDDDPYCNASRSHSIAAQWQAPLTLLHGAGHINADSGLGIWEQGLHYLAAVTHQSLARAVA